ncbi:MAG: DUF4065 domain-containing protein [Ruminococcus sp.]|nr:DUF4065 domain-containing protein [Ruminococcus sp.]
MYKIFDIANWFLGKEAMDQKKVQKLCYYTQAWSLAIFSKPIIDCKFEAWAHGPVCRELWSKLHVHTYFDIPQDALKSDSSVISNIDDIELLERVWETYKDFSGYQLEVLTHKERPWMIARGDTPEFQRCTTEISEDEMKHYYSTLYLGDGLGE